MIIRSFPYANGVLEIHSNEDDDWWLELRADITFHCAVHGAHTERIESDVPIHNPSPPVLVAIETAIRGSDEGAASLASLIIGRAIRLGIANTCEGAT